MSSQEDEEFTCFHVGSEMFAVDGIMGLHVDDYLGAGEGVNGAGDLEGDYDGSFASFRDRLCGLSVVSGLDPGILAQSSDFAEQMWSNL